MESLSGDNTGVIDMDDKPQGTYAVTLKPVSYEWDCPVCGERNEVLDFTYIVTCERCRTSFHTLLAPIPVE